MSDLTLNEAALIYCIVGSPGVTEENRNYPTVEEAINYMIPPKKKQKKNSVVKEVVYEQMKLF